MQLFYYFASMNIALALACFCGLVISVLLAVSLLTLFRKSEPPGPVEERLDLALEVELIAESIERAANNDL